MLVRAWGNSVWYVLKCRFANIYLFVAVKCKFYENKVTISGISIGGTFAQIVHLSLSNLFFGIGIFAACKSGTNEYGYRENSCGETRICK